MTTKLSQVRACMDSGDWRGALRIASKFAALGKEGKAIRQAWEAYTRPAFYQELGYDIEQLKDAGRQALEARYR